MDNLLLHLLEAETFFVEGEDLYVDITALMSSR